MAGIITAVTGLILALHQIGVFSDKEYQADPLKSPKEEMHSPDVPGPLPDWYFFDDFSVPKLGERWKILEPDQQRWSLEPNGHTLLIITQKGSLWESDKNLRNQFILDLKLSETDYEVIVKASFQIQSQHNSMSLALFQDDDNFLEVGYSGRVGPINREYIMRVPHFTKEISGQRNVMLGAETRWDATDSPETLFLRIERVGNQYSGYYSFVETQPPKEIDDIRWTKIGTHAWINFDGRLSLWADNSNNNIVYGGPPVEVTAKFDFVIIRETGI